MFQKLCYSFQFLIILKNYATNKRPNLKIKVIFFAFIIYFILCSRKSLEKVEEAKKKSLEKVEKTKEKSLEKMEETKKKSLEKVEKN